MRFMGVVRVCWQIFRVYHESRVFHECLKGVSMVFRGWTRGVSRGVNGFRSVFQGFTRLFWQYVQYISRLQQVTCYILLPLLNEIHGCCKGVLTIFLQYIKGQGCFTGVSWVFQGCFKGVSRVFCGWTKLVSRGVKELQVYFDNMSSKIHGYFIGFTRGF